MSKQNKNISRRRSRSLGGFACRDLCENVPKSLSPSERLMMLLELSFQHALSVAQADTLPKEDSDVSNLKQKGTECWKKIKATIEEKGLDKSAVYGPCDTHVEDKVEECNKAIAKLEAESVEWDNEMLFYRECLNKEIQSPYSIRCSEVDKKVQLYDYTDIITETSAAEKMLSQQIQRLPSTKESLKRCLDSYNMYSAALQNRYQNHIHKDASRTPKTLIRKFASTRNIKPYNVKK